MTPAPAFGDFWLVDFDPVRGHEQGKKPRPAVVVSHDILNQSPYEIIMVAPLTRTDRGIPFHVPVTRYIDGAPVHSFIMCEQTRAISTERLIRFLNDRADATIMAQIAARLHALLYL